MIETLFDTTQDYLLLACFVSLVLSLGFHIRDKEFFALGFLLMAGAFMFSFAAVLDPFLNLWDERFHALVAKNLLEHPLMPTLYDDPVLSMEYDRWDRYHIWLHKQPLFLWQIALSFKLFGVSELSLRIPNIVMGTALILASYRSGRILFSRNVGLISGMLILTSAYLVQLAAGRQELEHNDFSFLVYISLSIWALIEYRSSGSKVWIVMIGVFAGLAILCKWLVGLLVYFGWGVFHILNDGFRVSRYRDLLTALAITLAIAVPWQILTFAWYPLEASIAYRFNWLHLTVPLDGHRGTIWYHFDQFNVIYGAVASFFVLPGFYLMLKRAGDKKKMVVAIIAMVVIVYVFFTVAATKMPSFTIVVLLPVCLALSMVINEVIWRLSRLISAPPAAGNYIFGILILAFALYRFDIGYLEEEHSLKHEKNEYSRMLLHNKQVFQSLDLPENAVLFNVRGRHYVDAMFYTEFPAYNFIPTGEQLLELKRKDRVPAVFSDENTPVPGYLEEDPSVLIINKSLQGYY